VDLMPLTFLASIKSYRSDHTDVVLALSVPESSEDIAHKASQLRDQVVSVTIHSAKELTHGAKARLKK
jgi:hypothetical protein